MAEAPTADQVYLQQSQSLLPKYQERFLKDLLANIYYTDETTGQVSGFASRNPLVGQMRYDENGNVIYERDAAGNIKYDAFGEPVPEVIGGIARPEVMPFTPLQQEAIQMGAEGIGSYKPYYDAAASGMGEGLATIGSARSYIPVGSEALAKGLRTYNPYDAAAPYMNEWTEDVIDRAELDIQRQGDLEELRVDASAAEAGAFGGSRHAVAQQENQRNVMDQMARTGSQLRMQSYDKAMTQAQSVFENEMARNQTGAQIYQQLGQGIGSLGSSMIGAGGTIGALGSSYQGLLGGDVDTLFNLGSLEQAQRQSEYDVQREGQIEEAYEPYQRFAYMSDIFRGVPSTQGTLTVGSAPSPNPITQFLGNAMGVSAYNKANGGTGILSGLMR